MKRSKLEHLVWIIFGVLGLTFLVVSNILIRMNFISKENIVKTHATIINISDNQEVYVSYLVNSEMYTNKLSSYSSSYHIGKEITIYYDKNDPAKIIDNSIIVLIGVFGGIGLIFIIVAGIIIAFKINRSKVIKWLKESGNIVNASYTSIELNTNYTINGRHPYNIICEWYNSSDNKKYIFKSENIWFDPSRTITERNIKTFPVYINPNKIKQYYMDVDMILANIVDLR